MTGTLNTVLIAISVPLFAGAAFMLGLGLWDLFLGKLLGETAEERTGFVKALQTVALRQLGVVNRRFMWPSYEANVRRKLITAGEPAQLKPEEIMAMQELAAIVGLVFGLFILNAVDINLAYSLLFMLVGLWYPRFWLSDQVKKRHHQITRALPYNLDLLTLSVEAGLDFTAALNKVVEKGRGGPLRDEFLIVLKQLKMGKTREEALKALIARCDLPSLTSFVSALIQADRMGTSIGKVLRIQSTQLRIERTQKAEKLANEAPVKMLFPLIACIFPTVFMVLFGPIIFRLVFIGVD
jgi:tight adherence protein C